MTKLLWFLIGFWVGGLFMTVVLSCLQAHRAEDYESAIAELEAAKHTEDGIDHLTDV